MRLPARLYKRLDALERRVARRSSAWLGFHQEDVATLRFLGGDIEFRRDPDESLAAFEARAEQEARRKCPAPT